MLEAADFTPRPTSAISRQNPTGAPASAQTHAAGRAAQLKASYQTLLAKYIPQCPACYDLERERASLRGFLCARMISGARYVALTKFDGTSWSEPVRVDAGAILTMRRSFDRRPDALACLRPHDAGARQFLVSYAQYQNIVVGTVNKDTLAFTEQKTYQSDSSMRSCRRRRVNGTPGPVRAESAVTDRSVVNPAAQHGLYSGIPQRRMA